MCCQLIDDGSDMKLEHGGVFIMPQVIPLRSGCDSIGKGLQGQMLVASAYSGPGAARNVNAQGELIATLAYGWLKGLYRLYVSCRSRKRFPSSVRTPQRDARFCAHEADPQAK